MITIQTAVITKTEQVGFLTLNTDVIVAWAHGDNGRGHMHGTQLEFPTGAGVTDEEIQTAVFKRYEEIQREFRR